MIKVEIKMHPFGVASDEYTIAELDIANVEEVENLGFGHSICNYSVKVHKHIGSSLEETTDYGLVERHDRRDGVIELLRRACEKIESL